MFLEAEWSLYKINASELIPRLEPSIFIAKLSYKDSTQK